MSDERTADKSALVGPFASNSPGLGYREYLAEFDEGAEMWRQLVPGQSGRGLALGRWGLHPYEEYADYGAISLDGDPLWVPIVVEWGSVTTLDGMHVRLDPWYLEKFHENPEWESGDDCLPAVGIVSATGTWPPLVGPYSISSPDGLWWELVDGTGQSEAEMIMPVSHVLPIDDDEVLAAAQRTIKEIERIWPMDMATPSTFGVYSEWGEMDLDEARQLVYDSGHTDACIHSELPGTDQEWNQLVCQWDHEKGMCYPCGGQAHITAVLDSFTDAQPYERLCFDPLLVPYWDRLKQRNVSVFTSLLRKMEANNFRERNWYYSYLRQWSPWAHSSQVPELLLV